jgi:hypothetical protein
MEGSNKGVISMSNVNTRLHRINTGQTCSKK